MRTFWEFGGTNDAFLSHVNLEIGRMEDDTGKIVISIYMYTVISIDIFMVTPIISASTIRDRVAQKLNQTFVNIAVCE